MKIKTKIFFTTFCSSVFLLLIASFLFYSSEKKTLTQQISNQLTSIASLQKARLESIILQNVERLKLVASRTQLRISLEKHLADDRNKAHQEKMIRILQDAKSSIESFNNISIVSLDRSIVASTTNPPFIENIQFDNWLFVQAQKENSADTLFFDNNGNLSVLLAGPLHLNGKLLGVIFIESNVNNIISSVDNYSGLGETGEIIVARNHNNGSALFLLPTRFDRKAALKRITPKEQLNHPLQQPATSTDTIRTGIDYRGQKVLTIANYIELTKWIVIVKLDESEAFANIVHTRNLIAFIAIILLSIAIVISVSVSRSIAKPLIHLSTLMQKVSKGDLSLIVPKFSNDELGVLSQSFSEMIQKRKQAEYDLKAERDFVDKAIDAQSDTFFVFEISSGKALRWNHAFRDISGYTDDEIQSLTAPNSYYSKDDLAKAAVFSENILQKGGGTIELSLITKTGKSVPTEYNAAVLEDENGNPVNIIAIGRDLSDRKQAEQEKEKLESQLRQAHKMEAVGTMAGGIAHDFNNILTAILGYAEMIQLDTPDSSPVKDQIEEVLKAGNRAKELVKQILAFSRKAEQNKLPVQIHLLIQEVYNFLRATIPANIEIELDIDPHCGSILSDPTQIHQVILNLCTNAAYAMEKKGGILTIELKVVELRPGDFGLSPNHKPGPHILLSVKDTGVGIPQKQLDRIFDPYYTTKEVGKGSGMGLAVVHGIVLSHNGFVNVESTFGQGTTFRLFFPSIESDAKKLEQIETSPLPVGKEHILIVDDDTSIASLTQKRLETLGYQTTTKTSSTETLELFRAAPKEYDLVITDQTMPKMTGEQLAMELLSIRPSIPIVICTGYSSTIDSEKASLIGISAFIMKPVANRELAKTVRQILDAL